MSALRRKTGGSVQLLVNIHMRVTSQGICASWLNSMGERVSQMSLMLNADGGIINRSQQHQLRDKPQRSH